MRGIAPVFPGTMRQTGEHLHPVPAGRLPGLLTNGDSRTRGRRPPASKVYPVRPVRTAARGEQSAGVKSTGKSLYRQAVALDTGDPLAPLRRDPVWLPVADRLRGTCLDRGSTGIICVPIATRTRTYCLGGTFET